MKYKLNPSYHGGYLVKLLKQFFKFICIFFFIINLAQPSTINAYCFYNYSQDPLLKVTVYSSRNNADVYKGFSKYFTEAFTYGFYVFTGGIDLLAGSAVGLGKEAAAQLAEFAIKDAAETAAKNAAKKAGEEITEQAIKEAGAKAVQEAAEKAASKVAANIDKNLAQKFVETTRQKIINQAAAAAENLKKFPNLPAKLKTQVNQFVQNAKNLTTEQVQQIILSSAKDAKTTAIKGVKNMDVFDWANVGLVATTGGQVAASSAGAAKAVEVFNIANRIFTDLTTPGAAVQELFDLLGIKLAYHEIPTGGSACWNWKDIQKQLSHPTILTDIITFGTAKGIKNVGALYFEVEGSDGKHLYSGTLVIFCGLSFDGTPTAKPTVKQFYPFLDDKGKEHWELLSDGFDKGYYLNPYILPSLSNAEDICAFEAASSGNLTALKKAIKNKANLNNNYLSLNIAGVDDAFIGKTPLHIAVKNKNIACIKELLAAGADPNITSIKEVGANDFMPEAVFDSDQLRYEKQISTRVPTGITPFTMALAKQNKEIVRLLLPKVKNVWLANMSFPPNPVYGNYLNFDPRNMTESKPYDLDKAFQLAKQAYDLIESITAGRITAGLADDTYVLNTLDDTWAITTYPVLNILIDGQTLLHAAIAKKHEQLTMPYGMTSIIARLLQIGATPMTKNIAGQTALDLANTVGDSKIAGAITNIDLKTGAVKNPAFVVNPEYQLNPLLALYSQYKPRMKAFSNEKKAYEFLLDLADTDSLSAAVEHNDITTVKQLIKNGSKVNVISNGKTPLQRAILKGSTALAEELVNAGASPAVGTPWYDDAYTIAQQLHNKELIIFFDNITQKEKAAWNKKQAVALKDDNYYCSFYCGYFTIWYNNRQTDIGILQKFYQWLWTTKTVNGLCQNNNTLLHAAIMLHTNRATEGVAEGIIEQLLKKGADVTIKNNKGETALALAKWAANTYGDKWSRNQILQKYPHLK